MAHLVADILASVDAFAEASATLAQALMDSTNDPAEAIRLLIPLARWMPPGIPGSGPLHDTAEVAASAFSSNLRAAACAALGRATAIYQPISYQDAQSVRLLVCGVLDDEATRVADAGLDETFLALRTLKWAVALDLASKGATLAVLVEVETQVSMPSVTAAWTLYQDTSREPEIVASAAPAHPMFLPLDFAALSQ
jgi:prophage DNA circulation protein